MKTEALIIEGLGWLGTGLIVLAYFLISSGFVAGDSVSYQLINLFGAVFLGISVYEKKAWPVLALQGIWIVVAVWTLVQVFFRPA